MGRMLWSVILLTLAALPAAAQNGRTDLGVAAEVPTARPEAIRDWQAMRFGMFIHWGPVSLKGTEIGWSRMEPKREGAPKRIGAGHKGVVPLEEYDSLYKRFNPTTFDARAWAAIAKAAGMKYMVLTTKHHDGFCMFDVANTDYKITRSPFGRDVVREYADAAREAGLKVGFYYSQPDWRHPDFLTQNHARYIQYMHEHVRQLMSEYGKIDIIWFDGLGGNVKDWDSENLVRMIRRLQPGIVINNRAGLAQDFDTPEQRIGVFQNSRPWETCMTICRQWTWKPNDTMKSFEQCIQTLVSCACGDGNLLFNVGPMPTGEIEPRQVERLREMGAWLKKNGETIHGTRGGPFLLGRMGGSTHRGNTVYLHVFKWAEEAIALPDARNEILSATLFATGKPLPLKRSEGSAILTVPPAERDPIDTIIRLELSRPAEAIKPVAVWRSGALSAGARAKASNVYQKRGAHYGPQMALDDDEQSRWATDASQQQAWLEVDLGRAQAIGGFRILEASYPRVAAFTVEIEKDGEWTPAHTGGKIDRELKIRLARPVQAAKVRLNITRVSEGGPTIEEFQVLPPARRKERDQ